MHQHVGKADKWCEQPRSYIVQTTFHINFPNKIGYNLKFVYDKIFKIRKTCICIENLSNIHFFFPFLNIAFFLVFFLLYVFLSTFCYSLSLFYFFDYTCGPWFFFLFRSRLISNRINVALYLFERHFFGFVTISLQ